MRILNIIVHEIMDNCWKGLSEKFLSIDVILNLLKSVYKIYYSYKHSEIYLNELELYAKFFE